MALHEQSAGATDEWYTPGRVFEALGCRFDVDVASPGRFVWMNPPFGPRNGLVPWLTKFFAHGNGIALVPDRTSAPWWQQYAPWAEFILFIGPKLKFIGADGRGLGVLCRPHRFASG